MGGIGKLSPEVEVDSTVPTRGQALGRLCVRSGMAGIRSGPQIQFQLRRTRSTGEGGCLLRPKTTRFTEFRGPQTDLLDAEGGLARAAGKK
jgi:hypothetical protein